MLKSTEKYSFNRSNNNNSNKNNINKCNNNNNNNNSNNNNNNNNSNGKDNEWLRFGLRLGVITALHPFEYSKALIQLGYEPLAPVPHKYTFYRNTILFLPNIFQYTNYIRKTDGFLNCYRGLTPKLLGCFISMAFNENLTKKLGMDMNTAIDDEHNYIDTNNDNKYKLKLNSYNIYKRHLKRDVILSISSVIISQPFHVISIRMMAQFIDHETLYSSITRSIMEIYHNEGICGFFAGIIPKLLADICGVILSSSAIYLLKKYLNKNQSNQSNERVVQLAVSSLLYPLNVITTCMCVTGCRLMAGQPPFMPAYKNWYDCFNDLKVRGELHRGSCMFFRTTTTTAANMRKWTVY